MRVLLRLHRVRRHLHQAPPRPHLRRQRTALNKSQNTLNNAHAEQTPSKYEPHFEWTVLWIALAGIAVGAAAMFYVYRRAARGARPDRRAASRPWPKTRGVDGRRDRRPRGGARRAQRGDRRLRADGRRARAPRAAPAAERDAGRVPAAHPARADGARRRGQPADVAVRAGEVQPSRDRRVDEAGCDRRVARDPRRPARRTA